jgi:hypothetical protein
MRTTHTYALLPVSKAVFEEVAAKLREAKYFHAFDRGVIDMHGIALEVADEREAGPPYDENERAAFDVVTPEGHRYSVFASGRIDGFPPGMVIINRIHGLVSKAYADGFLAGKATTDTTTVHPDGTFTGPAPITKGRPELVLDEAGLPHRQRAASPKEEG